MTSHDTNHKIMQSINYHSTWRILWAGDISFGFQATLLQGKVIQTYNTVGEKAEIDSEHTVVKKYIINVDVGNFWFQVSLIRRLPSLQHCTNAKGLILELQYKNDIKIMIKTIVVISLKLS